MRYVPALDGLRALAVLAVMACHTKVPGMHPGMLGVDVFFVLSGFLITSILKDQAAHGGIRVGEFYIRRIRRLYPALLTMLALYVAIFPWFYAGHHLRDAGFAALYLTDYTTAFLTGDMATDLAIGHTWSLSVEEHFYMLWPLVVAGLALIRTRRFVAYLLIAAYMASTVYRLWSHVEIGWWATYCRFDTRTSGLILGATLAYLPDFRHRAWALAVTPCFAAAWWLTPWAGLIETTPIIFAEWGAAALVLWAMSGSATILEGPVLVYIGRISYGLYLFHWPVAWIVRGWDAPWWHILSITLLVAFPLAHYSNRYIEAPWRSRRVTEYAVSDSPVGDRGLTYRRPSSLVVDN